ncbi:amino acid adenylation domain-containing protein [Herpetosiphon sp. NSE202]|uniref:amino acid adenylation domain-containing protein n=1 Tax=Herpetosiphon sp. NSE202 TaxID=3351349 RepID=UPI003643C842
MSVGTIEGFQLSPQQKHVWWLAENGQNPTYANQISIKLVGTLDQAALQQALNTVTAENEILRTAFSLLTGMSLPVQVVEQRAAPSLSVYDLRADAQAEQTIRLNQQLVALQNQPFEQDQSLMHAHLIVFAADQALLLLKLSALYADQISMYNLVQELSTAYQAALGIEQPEQERLQYADLAEIFNELIDSEDMQAGREYWLQQQIQHALHTPLYPHQRAAGAHFQPVSIEHKLNPALVNQLRTIAQASESTLADVLFVGWAGLLGRLATQPEVVVARRFEGRNYDGLESALGLFAKYIPIKGQVAEQPSFSQAVQKLNATIGEVHEWQDAFIWEHVTNRPSTGAHGALCSYGFDYTIQPSAIATAELTWQIDQVSSVIERFDLRLAVIEKAGELHLSLVYDQTIFDHAEIEQFLTQYTTLLGSICQQPEAALDQLTIISAAERAYLVDNLNASSQAYAKERSLGQWFEQQAHATPSAIALKFGAQQLSYGELNQQANQLAHSLIQRGVGSDSLVGVSLERSPLLVVALLGILKAGAAYVPIDLSYPTERRAFIAHDSGASLLITSANWAAEVADQTRELIVIDRDWPSIAQSSNENPTRYPQPTNLAYVIYTSGSTGQPKGAMITHQGLTNYLTWATQAYPVAQGVGSIVHSPIGFDLTVTSLFAPLLVGQTVILLPEANPLEDLAHYLRSGQLSLLKLTPTHMELLNQLLKPEELAQSSHALVIGGEALLPNQIAPWLQHAPQTRLINEYGPTETVVGCCIYEVSNDAAFTGSVPIGKPIANTQLYVLDRYGELCPFGVAGELYIGGDGVARGYHQRPSLTAERFVPNPFSTEPGARFYKTGDLVRYRHDGNLEFLGRTDQQIKFHGFRIELGEIELALTAHPAIREAAVVARHVPHLPGEQHLVAYVSAKPDQSVQADGLRQFLAERLPEYMVPSIYMPLERLPITPNGKIDRRALPVPIASSLQRGEYHAPRNAVEQQLATIWASVLRLEQVGIDDNFFEIGGDSILSIQIVAKATSAGLKLNPHALFSHRTIRELAEVVGSGPSIDAEQGLIAGTVTLTPIQQWFFEQQQPHPAHWNQALLLAANTPIDAALLEQALQHVYAHHDSLRLRFTATDNGWKQQYSDASTIALQTIDISKHINDLAQALETAAHRIQASLDLHHGPLFQVALIQTSEQQRLLFVAHHLIIDGVSWRIVLDDLQTAYSQLQHATAVKLPAKTTSFKAWAERLPTYANQPTMAEVAQFWLPASDWPTQALPTDHASSTNSIATSSHVEVALSVEATKALLYDVPHAYQTQINDLLLSALLQAFERWTGQNQLVVDLEGHGREPLFEDIDLSRTVGWFTSLFPVRLHSSDPHDPATTIKHIKEYLRAVPHNGLAFGLLRYLNPELGSQLQALPAAQVSFNYLGQLDQGQEQAALLRLTQESVGATRHPASQRAYLIEINSSLVNHQLHVDWAYNSTIHEHATIATLANGFIEALQQLIAHCQAPNVGSYTPSDFPDEALSDDDLDAIMAQLGG